MSEIDYGPPVQLRPGRGGTIRIRRGGAVRNGNSGTAPKRFYSPGRAIRAAPHHIKHLPWPSRGKPLWDPLDPIIVAYQQAHPRVEAAWRSGKYRFIIEHKMPTSTQMRKRMMESLDAAVS